MGWFARLLSRLFGRPARGRPPPIDLGPSSLVAEPAPRATIEPTPPTLAQPQPQPEPGAAAHPDEPAAFVEVDDDEDAFEEEELAEDAEAELDLRPDLDVLVAERQSHLDETRAEAERLALSGEQRVRLTDPAGPGTLAEALARLEREGRVGVVIEEDEGAPVMVYTPRNGVAA